ncbi:hypothetical protein [Actinomadura sp. K4S16]|uniref:hypothetical protein n=1 Tax=Actinomadura sp. K4S16 TaxID=1316147 RepID=UPI0011EFE7E5|nr:hypothetical protein [Actinomadura sp. K4S16]
MSISQLIKWIALPAGFHPDGTLRLSVFVAPRLLSDEPQDADEGWDLRLERFPDFLDWPSRLATAAFTVRTDDPHDSPGPARPVGPPPDPALWRALFGPRTPVRSHVPDHHRPRQVMTYPARRMSSATRTGYAATATATPTELPRSETVSYDQEARARFEDFHRQAGEGVRPDQPEIDFHQMLSALGDHPHLLRRLGLVFDLSVPADRAPRGDMDQAVRLIPSWQSLLPAGASTDVMPYTWYVREPDLFAARGRGATKLGSLTRGLIMLPEEQFSVEQVDIDGAVQKALAMEPTDASGFPALRTSGFSLVRDGRAAFLMDDLDLAARLEEDLARHSTIVLFADDLVRGHRLDVWDEDAGRWFSLHERSVDYTVPGDPANSAQAVRAEGFFQVSLARPAGANAARLYVHERVVSWDGWSLSGPRPGKVLSEDPRSPDPADPATMPKRIPNTASTALPLEIEAAVLPGSLPRLRFGRRYRFRVRTVDLAGNGPALAEAPDLGRDYRLPGGEPAVFRRFEPVPAPPLMPRSRFTEGQTVDRLVIRSTPGQSAPDYTRAFNEDPLVREQGHPAYAAEDERHVVAPKAALQLVEWHGMLDAAIGSPDPAARREVYDLARRESGALDDPSLPGVEVVTVTRPDGTEIDRYVVHTGDDLAVPYLPDPMSAGAVVHGLPGADAVEVGWDGAQWHRPRSFRLRIADGDAAPQWDAGSRVLTVPLPQGRTATVRVASRAAPDEVSDLMGVLAWCREELDTGQLDPVMLAARNNRHWMVTPWREVELVHAVQRPLAAPDLELWPGFARDRGDTFVHLFGQVTVSPHTTERIDLLAEWREQVDDPALGHPFERDGSAQVFRLPLALAAKYAGDSVPEEVPCKLTGGALTFNTRAGSMLTPPMPTRQELGDTKHRRITYRATAASAFREYFPPEFADGRLSRDGRPVTVEVPSSAPPAAPRVLYCVPTQAWETATGEETITRRRRGGGIRVYLERPWFSSGDGELLGVLVAGETPLPDEPASSLVSLVGRDPVHVSESLGFLTAGSFPASVTTASGLGLPPVLERLNVTVLGHRPAYDPDTGRWFCDIDIDTGNTYSPFVRLALARYQPDSLPGLHLSEIVQTDIVRTLPDRTLTVSKPQLGVSVSGPSYQAPEGARMTARLEYRDTAVPDDVIGWRVVPGTVTELRPQFDEEGRQLASIGEIPVVGTPRPPGERLRVTVMEYERLPSDTADGTTTERLVYTDGIAL